MQPGQILVADHDGVYVIKMEGDVRLTLCVSFDQFIDTMFSRDDFRAIMFDLSAAEAVDSTTLGLMAKIAILAMERKQLRPMILSESTGINRTLDCMGFAEIFDIVSTETLPDYVNKAAQQHQGSVLDCPVADEAQAKKRVIEAHRILMDLNDKNRETFQDLVKTLEND